jgi:hypothetical protein
MIARTLEAKSWSGVDRVNSQGGERIGNYVLDIEEIDETQVAVAGGKGALLGALSRIEGVRVPPGFCVTTDACQRVLAQAPSVDDRLGRLSRLKPDDMARSSPGHTDPATSPPEPWSACPFPPGPSRGGPASSWTSRRPISKPTTSWSPPTPTPAGHHRSSRSGAW